MHNSILCLVLSRCTFLSLLILLFGLLLSHRAPAQTDTQQHLHIDSTPKWVIERDITLAEDIPFDELSDGIFYQLLDNQIKVDNAGNRQSYSRFVESLVNQTAVEESAQINIDFDPSYQKLVLNSLTVIRDGKRINRIANTKMSIFSRETELDNQLYNGDLTLNILLDDIQIGDTLDYSYTRIGANPVYKNVFSYHRSVNWSVPLGKQFIRVLWGKQDPLSVSTRNTEVHVDIKQLQGFFEYNVQLTNNKVVKTPSETPDWYDPYGKVYFNEVSKWQDVVDWAYPMYNFGEPSASVTSIADEINAKHTTPSEKIVAALQFTQENIRYVGIEMGMNSHVPTHPDETLVLKYGDCKDKTSLFISILQALDITAYPALVDTDDTKLLAELPPSAGVFNHVIVWLENNGKTFWLDPTLSHQQGKLTQLYQPDYGYALILKDGVTGLSSMEKEETQFYTHVTEIYTIPTEHDLPANLKISTAYTGYQALRRAWQLEQYGKNELAQDYEAFYQGIYSSLSTSTPMSISIQHKSGEFVIDENYDIATYWEKGDEHFEADYYPREIRSAIFKPKQITRDAPIAFEYPNNVKVMTHLHFEEDGWEFEPESFSEENDFFYYSSSVNFNDNILTLAYEYSAKVDHIPATRTQDYLLARDRVLDDAYYGIMKYADEATNSDSLSTTEGNWLESVNWVIVIAIAIGLCLIFIIVDWRIESSKRPSFEGTVFYPIHPSKFIVLSLVTFGTYTNYWMYRNWKAISAKTEEPISPFWRGFFAVIWLYPLYKALVNDSNDNYQKNKVAPYWLGIVLVTLYIIFVIIGIGLDNTIWAFFSLGNVLFLLPFIYYISYRNTHSLEAQIFNSKWRVRHFLTILIFLPLLIFSVASTTSWLPSEKVITQSELNSRDLTFFYRHKIIPANETIQYFYSDATFNIRDDGNGFTNNTVFSYWKDDAGVLHKETIAFNAILDIEVNFSESEFENTVITVYVDNDESFVLFASTINDGDDIFVEELKKRWQQQRIN
ncbi:DUF3857 domain-containing transglutaminase family protein [Agaribacter marinus]|uniref:DUF3857 domain-containing protein n=1 Tax=Agaribacter marinus TaxID=1431249 RepID=A0AA37SWN1_9ALTE|nr:DUF3857 domain-containing transglutaminase family protein [Agaribacter marinus]GLR69744.1 hypothetical protein GCM10007852_06520 [Agaribacter marinus]